MPRATLSLTLERLTGALRSWCPFFEICHCTTAYTAVLERL